MCLISRSDGVVAPFVEALVGSAHEIKKGNKVYNADLLRLGLHCKHPSGDEGDYVLVPGEALLCDEDAIITITEAVLPKSPEEAAVANVKTQIKKAREKDGKKENQPC